MGRSQARDALSFTYFIFNQSNHILYSLSFGLPVSQRKSAEKHHYGKVTHGENLSDVSTGFADGWEGFRRAGAGQTQRGNGDRAKEKHRVDARPSPPAARWYRVCRFASRPISRRPLPPYLNPQPHFFAKFSSSTMKAMKARRSGSGGTSPTLLVVGAVVVFVFGFTLGRIPSQDPDNMAADLAPKAMEKNQPAQPCVFLNHVLQSRRIQ